MKTVKGVVYSCAQEGNRHYLSRELKTSSWKTLLSRGNKVSAIGPTSASLLFIFKSKAAKGLECRPANLMVLYKSKAIIMALLNRRNHRGLFLAHMHPQNSRIFF